MIATKSLTELRANYSRIESLNERSFAIETDLSSERWNVQQGLAATQISSSPFSSRVRHYQFSASIQVQESIGLPELETDALPESGFPAAVGNLSPSAFRWSSESLQVSNSVSASGASGNLQLTSTRSWSWQSADRASVIPTVAAEGAFGPDIPSHDLLTLAETENSVFFEVAESSSHTLMRSNGLMALESTSSRSSFSSQLNWQDDQSSSTYFASQSNSSTLFTNGAMSVETQSRSIEQTMSFGDTTSSTSLSQQWSTTQSSLDFGMSLDLPQTPSLELSECNNSLASIQNSSSIQLDLSFGSRETFSSAQLSGLSLLNTQGSNQFQQTTTLGIAMF